MFERWRSFTLSKENFKETVEAIGETLVALGVSEKEAETGKELVEHIFSLQLSVRPEVCDTVKVRKRFGDISLRLETEGDEYNPLTILTEWNEDDPDYQRTIVLKSKKEQLSYAHSNGKNIVTIKVHEAGNKQIRYTLFAMVMGILAGAILKEMISPELITMVNKTVIGSIRTMFLNSLNMMIAPVVFFSIISGLTSISNASDIGRIGGKLVGVYMCTTVIATFFSIAIGLLMFHGGVPQMGMVTEGGGGDCIRHRPADFHVPHDYQHDGGYRGDDGAVEKRRHDGRSSVYGDGWMMHRFVKKGLGSVFLK